MIRPPSSRLGPLTAEERRKLIAISPVAGQYDETIDRESAFEVLKKKADAAAQAEAEQQAREAQDREAQEGRRTRTGFQLPDFGQGPSSRRGSDYEPRRTSNRQTVAEAAVKSITRTVASSLGRALVRGILGSLKKGF